MSDLDPKAISEMNNMVNLFDENSSGKPIVSKPDNTDSKKLVKSDYEIVQEGKKQIENLLNAFETLSRDDMNAKFGEVARGIKEEADTFKDVDMAVNTELTEDGFRFKDFEIKKTPRGYTVVDGKTVVAEKLVVKEAALAIVQLLEQGMPVNSKDFKAVLMYEEICANCLFDIKNNKKLIESFRVKNPNKAAIHEDKLDAVMEKYKSARKSIRNIYKKII